MELEVIFALIIGIASFLSGFTTMMIYYKKRKNKEHNDVSARLPSLIYIEIILLLWYLMVCIPLMLYLWFHFNEYNLLGSTIFIVSFTPVYTTHIIRIWLLKLKYVITSLSMLNQLGMLKWREIRNQTWTKIYHKHKWTHNISILITISIIFTIIITVIYLSISLINIYYGIYIKIIIFASLTLCLIIGLFSIKSFQDPFNIFREEIMVLSIWLITLIIYAIFHIFLWNKLLTHDAWTVIVTFFSGIAAILSILIHFHFNQKSIETEQNSSFSPLPIIVSTKEGLEKFLQFLVTELSVENLEFFTLSMRWRHRLVLRDNRRARKRANKKLSQFPFDPKNTPNNTTGAKAVVSNSDVLQIAATEQVPHTPDSPNTPNTPNTPTFTYTNGKQDTPVSAFGTKLNKRSSKLENISEMIASIPDIKSSVTNKRVTTTNQRLLEFQKQNPGSEADTHLKALPFPILTFEFLDRDVIKNGGKNKTTEEPKLKKENTLTETYVLEFSKTKSSAINMPQLTKKRTATETVVSVFFEQYDVMQVNRRRMTEMSKTTQSRTYGTKTIPSSLGPKFNYNTTDSNIKTRTNTTTGTPVTKHLAVTPAQSPAPPHIVDLDTINNCKAPDPPLIRQISSDVNFTLNKNQKSHDPINPNPITPYHGAINNSGDMQNSGEFNTIVLDSNVLKEGNENEPQPLQIEKKSLGFMSAKSITVKINIEEKEYRSRSKTGSSTPKKKNKDKNKKQSRSANSTPIVIEEEKKEFKPTHILQDSDHKQIQNTLKLNNNNNMTENNNMFCIVDRLSVWRMNDNINEQKVNSNSNDTVSNDNEKRESNICVNVNNIRKSSDNNINGKERNAITFGGWFSDDNGFEVYDKEWTEDFMKSKRVSYDRFVTLSEEINVSFVARNNLRDFFKEYDTVKKFKDCNIANYDISLEIAWKDVWQNLNDSLRRFHHSKYYKEWKDSNAAHALHVIPPVQGTK